MPGDETYIELGWTGGHITFGSGYDVLTRKLRSSPFKHFDVKPDDEGNKSTPNIYSIETLEELKQAIKSEVKASVPIQGVRVEASSSFLKSVKLSNKNLLQVVQHVIEEPLKRATFQELKLTSQAVTLLGEVDGPKKFQERYGDFFVYGCRSKSAFAGVLTYKADSSEALDEFKSALSIDAGNIASTSAALEKIRKEYKSTITSNLKIHIDGYRGFSEVVVTKSLDDAYVDFQENYQTVPYLALLCHYSAIDSLIPRNHNPLEGMGPVLENAFQRLYIMQSEIISSPMKQANQLSKRVTNLGDDLATVDVTKKNSVKRLVDEIHVCGEEFNLWETRASLLEDAEKLSKPSLVSDKWIEADTKREWTRGVMSFKGHTKWNILAGDVLEATEISKTESCPNQFRYKTHTIGSHDRTIVGFKITGHRNDPYNGSFRIHQGNILDSEMKVELCSGSWAVMNWSITTWSVDKLLYGKEIS